MANTVKLKLFFFWGGGGALFGSERCTPVTAVTCGNVSLKGGLM